MVTAIAWRLCRLARHRTTKETDPPLDRIHARISILGQTRDLPCLQITVGSDIYASENLVFFAPLQIANGSKPPLANMPQLSKHGSHIFLCARDGFVCGRFNRNLFGRSKSMSIARSFSPIAGPSGSCSLGGGFKRKPRVAGNTLTLVLMPLKYRFTSIFNTIGTQIMHGLIFTSRVAKAIHDCTGWRFPKLVSIKVGLKSVYLCQFILQRRKLEFQIRVRHLRICYLHSQLAQRQFDISICTTLRRLEQRLYGFKTFGDVSSRGSRVSNQFQQATKILELQIHTFL